LARRDRQTASAVRHSPAGCLRRRAIIQPKTPNREHPINPASSPLSDVSHAVASLQPSFRAVSANGTTARRATQARPRPRASEAPDRGRRGPYSSPTLHEVIVAHGVSVLSPCARRPDDGCCPIPAGPGQRNRCPGCATTQFATQNHGYRHVGRATDRPLCR
jgi:hypothetical protein